MSKNTFKHSTIYFIFPAQCLFTRYLYRVFQCSEVCGGGIKERKVVCQSFDGTRELFGEESCAEAKPISSVSCNEQPCKVQPKYVTIVWNYGEWSKVKLFEIFPCNGTI